MRSLTPEQTAVLDLVAKGHTDAESADILGVSQHTMKTHKRNIYARLGANSAPHAVALAAQWPGAKPNQNKCQD